MNTITTADFLSDSHGKIYSDVANDSAVDWDRWVNWFNVEDRQVRLELAEIHFDMPALAGVVKELESETFVRNYFDNRAPDQTKRVKQALGTLVSLHMVARGWSTAGKKGSLGRREPTYTGTGAHNTPRSFSKYILSAERYKRV